MNIRSIGIFFFLHYFFLHIIKHKDIQHIMYDSGKSTLRCSVLSNLIQVGVYFEPQELNRFFFPECVYDSRVVNFGHGGLTSSFSV